MTGKRDVSNEVELKNGKGNSLGWSVHEIWHDGKQIGEIYCGVPKITDDRYFFTEKQEGNVQRVTIFRKEIEITAPGTHKPIAATREPVVEGD